MVCHACGGSIHAIRRYSRRGQPRVHFTCNDWRANTACGNSMSAIVDDVDSVVVDILRREVLSPDVMAAVIARDSRSPRPSLKVNRAAPAAQSRGSETRG